MDRDQLEGKMKEGAGSLTGDKSMENEGKGEGMLGDMKDKAGDMLGNARDSAEEAAGAAKERVDDERTSR